MNVHNKDDKCCCDWKQQIKIMWERLQTTIYGVKVNGNRVYPDGDGIVNIVIGESGIPIATEEAIGGVLSASDDGKVSVDPLTGEMTANGLSDAIDDVEQLESKIIALQNEDISLGNRLTSAEGRLTTAEADIDEHDQDIVTLDGRVDALDTAVSGLQTGKQDKLTAGEGITITNKIISSGKQIYTGDLEDLIVIQGNNAIVTRTFDLVFIAAGGNPNVTSATVHAGVYKSDAHFGWTRGTSNYAGYIYYRTSDSKYHVLPPTSTTAISDNRILSTSDMSADNIASWAIFV